MRLRFTFILTAFVLLVLSGCTKADAPSQQVDDGMAELCVKLRIPNYNVTKAGEEVSALEEEYTMKALHIYVYLSEDCGTYKDGYQLGFITPNQTQHMQTQYEDRYFLRIPKEIALAKPKVDVYVIGNRGALGINWWNMPSRTQLDELVISGDYFGINTSTGIPLVSSLDIGTNGLPFSAVGKDLPMEGDYPSLTTPTITLKRAVSKLRIVVSQLADAVGPVLSFTLDEIKIDGGAVASEEYLFNDSVNDYKIKTYDDTGLVFPVPSYENVAQNPSPQDYAFQSGMSGQDYEDKVLEGIEEGVLTDIGPYYLREAGSALKGHIKYTMSGDEQKTVNFTMADGGFARNHSWIIYIYFLRDQMEFTVSWTDWEHGMDFTLGE